MDFLSVKKNAYFLRTPSLAYLIIPVCQILYNLREYVRVMKDIVTDFSLPCMHGKDVEMSFLHGAYLVDCIMVARQKL